MRLRRAELNTEKFNLVRLISQLNKNTYAGGKQITCSEVVLTSPEKDICSSVQLARAELEGLIVLFCLLFIYKKNNLHLYQNRRFSLQRRPNGRNGTHKSKEESYNRKIMTRDLNKSKSY